MFGRKKKDNIENDRFYVASEYEYKRKGFKSYKNIKVKGNNPQHTDYVADNLAKRKDWLFPY
ncbi:MAG: hypothetical protein DRM99_02405 [Thermoplasmata archaeon]|mgnify:CR=1 FL=1|nr:MAG: hypothetical protein DRM99_02405 [Thermoplasmata archaeon]